MADATSRLTAYTLLRSFGWSVREALACCYQPGGPRITLYAPEVVR